MPDPIYTDNIKNLGEERDRRKGGGAVGSGDDGGSDDMEQRVKALEESHKLIVDKLGGISDAIKDLRYENSERFHGIESRLTGLEKALDAKAAKSDLTPIEAKLGTIDGTVRGLPGIPAMIMLVVSTVTLCLGGATGLAIAFAKYLKP